MDSYEDQRCVFEIEMEKDENGLGLTVAGYICEKGIYYGFSRIIKTATCLIFRESLWHICEESC